MRAFSKLLFNPISAAVAIVHWLVFFFSAYGEEHSAPFHFFYEPLLSQWMLTVNLIPLVISGFLSAAIQTLIGTNFASDTASFIVAFTLVSLQWLFIGAILNLLVRGINNEFTDGFPSRR